MIIKFKLNKTDYEIEATALSYNPKRIRINNNKDSPNYGKPSFVELGYFKNLTEACKRCRSEEIGLSEDVVSLMHFASVIAALNTQLTKQLSAVEI